MKLTTVLLALIVSASVPTGRGHEPKQDRREKPKVDSKVSELMQRKLEHSQKVLGAIAVSDFDQVAKNAEGLIALSKKAEWRVIQTPRYLQHSDEFRQAAEGLVKNARAKNVDAAALSYVEMTLSCFRCHGYVREVRKASLDHERVSGLVAAR